MKKLPIKLKFYLYIIFIITLILTVHFLNSDYAKYRNMNLTVIIFFGILAIITESYAVVFKKISCTTTFAVTTTVYFLFGPFVTIIVTMIGLTFCVFKENDNYKHILNQPWFVTTFNYCCYILQIIVGNYFYTKLGGTFQFLNSDYSISITKIYQLFIYSIIACSVNWLLLSIMFSLLHKKNVIYSLANNIKLSILNSIALVPFALILALLYKQYAYVGVLLFIFPIMLARYTFSLYADTKSQFTDTVDALMRAMEARDKYTEGHAQRVAELVGIIAKELKYNDWTIEKLNIASLLHDVGKIGIDDSILNKPGKLSDEEYSIIKSHPVIGYNILKDVKNLREIVEIVKHHHERYDGKGYPDGTVGDELKLDAYIVQLADSVDAMTTDRPYRKALPPEKVISEIEKNSGTQFHPKVVDAYLKALKKQNNNIQR